MTFLFKKNATCHTQGLLTRDIFIYFFKKIKKKSKKPQTDT